ncbi:MAG: ATP-binding protein [Planctomycetaceae bacterium]|jgi:hypothetical protein|nr:ATP-binding protein [Planctomycetaceae bacterium]
MTTEMKKLPIGIQTFEKIREEGYLYVDKTKYLLELIENGAVYFLARPRRFGKSLTVSTFDALFSGKKELFKGLYAEEFMSRSDFKPSPVIRLDLSKVTTVNGIDVFQQSIEQGILEAAEKLQVPIQQNLSLGDSFRNLISETAKKYNSKVVILIDEYDKPSTDFIDDIVMANKIREILRSYYVQIKANDEYLRFAFMTGISKFTKFGVFSTLNNVQDISVVEKYGQICGITHEELLQYFPQHIEATAQKFQIPADELTQKIKNYYDGFCFDIGGKNRLYNPFSTLYFFQFQEFLNYWIESGTPSMLAKYMKERNLTVEQFRNYPYSKNDLFNSKEIENTSPENYLYQCGYLSIRPGTTNEYALDYPNTEVLNAMSELVSDNLLHKKNEHINNYKSQLLIALSTWNYELLVETFNTLLASIPYDDFYAAARQNVLVNGYKFPVQEWLYRSTILAFLRGCGIATVAEMHTNLGRADMVVTHKGNTFILELKVAYADENPSDKAEEALRQIREKNYAKPYPNATCIGLAIDDKKRQITEFRV